MLTFAVRGLHYGRYGVADQGVRPLEPIIGADPLIHLFPA
jgi:hypothetical protein